MQNQGTWYLLVHSWIFISHLLFPILTYGLPVWGQACKSYLDKLLILQKRELRFVYFAKKNEHTVPLFINANPLTLKFLYYKRLFELMHDVRNVSAPPKLCHLFTKTSSIHSYNTRSAASNKFLRKTIKA